MFQIISVSNPVISAGNAFFCGHFLPEAQAQSGMFLLRTAGQKECIRCAVIADNMAEDCLVGFLIIAGDADTAAVDAAQPEHRDFLQLCLVDDFFLHLCIMQISGGNNQGSKCIETNQFTDTCCDAAAGVCRIAICGTVERSNAVAIFPCSLIKFRKKLSFQKSMCLR